MTALLAFAVTVSGVTAILISPKDSLLSPDSAEAKSVSCERMLNGKSRGVLRTTWANGEVYEEKVFFTRSNGAYYIKWDNSQDWFPISLSRNNFSFKRYQNWQDYSGICRTEQGPFPPTGMGASNIDVVRGSTFSYPNQTPGNFKLIID